MKKFKEQFIEVVDNYHKAKFFNNKITGISTGFKQLDYLTGGFQPGEFTIIAAKGANGMPALITTFIANQLISLNQKILIFCTVDSYNAIINRLVSNMAEICAHDLLRGEFSEEKLREIIISFQNDYIDKLNIDDTFPLSVEYLFQKISALAEEGFNPNIPT